MTTTDQAVSTVWLGEPAQRIVGGNLTATVLPHRGGRIVSMAGSDGHEWLAPPLHPMMPAPTPGASFVDGDVSGWDECAPTIVACVDEADEVPDHGDLWDTPWHDDGVGLAVTGRSLGYDFRRVITGDDLGLTLRYRATALRRDMPFLWAAHPQFRAPKGASVQFDRPVTVVDVVRDEGPSSAMPWVGAITGIDALRPGETRKFYVHPDERVARVELTGSHSQTLVMEWDLQLVPYLGLWFDKSRWSREPVIAIEPATGFYDSLDRARSLGRVAHLRVGEAFEWWLRVSLL